MQLTHDPTKPKLNTHSHANTRKHTLASQHRAVLLDGLRNAVPTGHSVALCCMFGPLGVLSHLLTRTLVPRLRGSKAPLAPFA